MMDMTKTQSPAVAQKPPVVAQKPPVDPRQTREIATFKHELPLTTCRVDPTGQFVFAGAEDNSVHRWPIGSGEKTTLTGNRSWVRSIDFSPDGRTMVTADWAGTLCWWRTNDPQPKPLRTLEAHRGFCRWVRFRPDGSHLATCGNDNLVKLWSAEGELVSEMAGHKRHPYAVAFHPRRGELVSEDLMGIVKVWSVPEGKELREFTLTEMSEYDETFRTDMGGARDMAFSGDGSLLACAGITHVQNAFAGVQDPLIVLVDAASFQTRAQLKAKGAFRGVGWGVRCHRDGFIIGGLAQQNGRGALCFWDGEKSQEKSKEKSEKESKEKSEEKTEPFHTLALEKAVRGIDLLPDNRRLAAAHSDGTLRLYDMTASG